MKKCLASRYIKKTDLQPEENERILQDLLLYMDPVLHRN